MIRYIVALLIPFLAMQTCGKIFQATACLLLQVTVIGWLPAAIWALFVVHDKKADERHAKFTAMGAARR